MDWSAFLAGISAPARRALEAAAIRSFEALALRTEAELLSLHGLGPKSLEPIRTALREAGLAQAGAAESARRNDTPETRTGTASVDAFIAGYPPPVRTFLEELREVIRENAPGAAEKIAYGIPTFVLNGNLVHFSGYARHIGFYPGGAGIESFAEELSRYETSKGTVRFPLDQPLPLDLIARIVRFRVKQNLAKKKRVGAGR